MNTRIARLPDTLISQIAAGEVVERPASVVRELIDNALDAGATRIVLRLVAAGVQAMVVEDNGSGMNEADLPMALTRHATSKIAQWDDLQAVTTMGFRGEALAAIASVSHTTVLSRQSQSAHAWELDGLSGQMRPAARSVGTSVTVRDLFFSTPARRKFLKTDATELAHCLELVRRHALARPDVAFEVWHDNKRIEHWPVAQPSPDETARMADVLGPAFIEQSLLVGSATKATDSKTGSTVEPASHSGIDLSAPPIDPKQASIHVHGRVEQAQFAKERGARQFLYVNGRFVKDKTISHAIRLAFEDVLHGQRQPAYVLFVDVPPAQVDVNVHPTKSEVRFRQAQAVHQAVRHAIENALAPSRAGHLKASSPSPLRSPPAFSSSSQTASTSSGFSSSTRNLPSRVFESWQAALPLAQAHEPHASHAHDEPPKDHEWHALHEDTSYSDLDLDLKVPSLPKDSGPPCPDEALGQALAQLGGTYILAENAHGLVLIDMHAAHERILYEQLKQAWQSGQMVQASQPVDRAAAWAHTTPTDAPRLPSQTLLVPITIDASPTEIDALHTHASLLKQLGLELDALSHRRVVIRAVPTAMAGGDIAALVQAVLHDLLEHGASSVIQARHDALLATMACHGAVRSHDPMSLSAMNALLRQMEATPRADQCNHGRPTWHQLDWKALDAFFWRGQ
jgi:DNA mismatch repair protein MutL